MEERSNDIHLSTADLQGKVSFRPGSLFDRQGGSNLDRREQASQAGTANYVAATPVMVTVVVAKADQAITFGSLASQPFGTAPFVPSGATASSGLGVSFSSTTPLVCTVSAADAYTASRVSLIYTGTCTIAANQPGNSSINPAPQVTQSFAVTAGAQAPQVIDLSDAEGRR